MAKIASLGVKYLGGCCGTDDEYIKQLSLELETIKYKERKVSRKSMVCSANEFLEIDGFTMNWQKNTCQKEQVESYPSESKVELKKGKNL